MIYRNPTRSMGRKFCLPLVLCALALPAVNAAAQTRTKTAKATEQEATATRIAKVDTIVEMTPLKPLKADRPEETLFIEVEQQASFPGGMTALAEWLGANLRYPETAVENNVQGRVIVQFTVEKDGSITAPKVVRGVDKDLDSEALRIVNSMPKWNPAKNNGEVVRTQFILPISFRFT